MDQRFRATPKPEEEVVAVLERALRAAKAGRVRTALLILVTHQQVETPLAGERSSRRTDSLLAGLAKAKHKILTEEILPDHPPDSIP